MKTYEKNEKKREIGYKIVYVKPSGRRISAHAPGMATVSYRRRGWVEPPEWLKKRRYGLTYFKTLEQAFNFYRTRYNNEFQIWEVEVKEKVRLKRYCDLQELAGGYLLPDTIGWPEETAMAMRMKLQKRII